jgi:hypothetical protein
MSIALERFLFCGVIGKAHNRGGVDLNQHGQLRMTHLCKSCLYRDDFLGVDIGHANFGLAANPMTFHHFADGMDGPLRVGSVVGPLLPL